MMITFCTVLARTVQKRNQHVEWLITFCFRPPCQWSKSNQYLPGTSDIAESSERNTVGTLTIWVITLSPTYVSIIYLLQ